MNSLKIAICDDQPQDRQYLSDLVQKWASASHRRAYVQTFSSAENFLFQYAQESDLDILLLDIEMPAMDGVSLAKKIRQENETMQIIFITGYADYMAEGYEVAALHYLMKPVSPDKLYAVLERAVKKVQSNETVLYITSGGEMLRIPLHTIRYIDVQGNYCTIHAGESYTVKETLSDLMQQLDGRFFRTGRSAIVNLTYVRRVTKTDVYLADGAVLALPRSAYHKINQALIEME